jgi:hypothetical protein
MRLRFRPMTKPWYLEIIIGWVRFYKAVWYPTGLEPSSRRAAGTPAASAVASTACRTIIPS